jgi:hypothetical protein
MPIKIFNKLKNFLIYFLKIIYYISDLFYYKRKINKEIKQQYPLKLMPVIEVNNQSGIVSKHYFFQDLWAAKKIYASGVKEHYDVGSSLEGFLAHVSIFCYVNTVDIRPQNLQVDNIFFIKKDFLETDFLENSIESLSCLHVAEHIGLGRYGDKLDPFGTEKIIQKLQNILTTNGNLYFSVPIGKQKTCFNAHRIFYAQTIINLFDKLDLKSFSAVNDGNKLIQNASLHDFDNAKYSCGLFHFTKNQLSTFN